MLTVHVPFPNPRECRYVKNICNKPAVACFITKPYRGASHCGGFTSLHQQGLVGYVILINCLILRSFNYVSRRCETPQ